VPPPEERWLASPPVQDWAAAVDRVAAESRFSGVVYIERAGEVELAQAYGFADRAHGIATTVDTQFGVASGSKTFTALTVVSLIESGRLELATTARSLLGDDLPLIDDEVTVEHLLSHRSGIGDYLDEDLDLDFDDYLMPVPVQELATTEDFVRVLDGHPPKFAPGADFSYCNGGYVVLALIAERASGRSLPDLVDERVCGPAGMTDTAFLRSDELPGSAALGYLHADGLRTNVFHLPVRATGDGGAFTTARDVSRLWAAFFAGRIVSSEWVRQMVAPRSTLPSGNYRYGFGFWLDGRGDVVMLEGADTGASFRSVHDPTDGLTYTVLSNVTDGADAMAQLLADLAAQRFRT
jgi:CubicO group peptidase (beta-lactamase class C family)